MLSSRGSRLQASCFGILTFLFRTILEHITSITCGGEASQTAAAEIERPVEPALRRLRDPDPNFGVGGVFDDPAMARRSQPLPHCFLGARLPGGDVLADIAVRVAAVEDAVEYRAGDRRCWILMVEIAEAAHMQRLPDRRGA